MRFLILFLGVGLSLAACQTRPDVVDELACGSRDYLPYVGRSADTLTLPPGAPVRVLRPDMDPGPDYVYDRINLVTDRKGIIREIACG